MTRERIIRVSLITFYFVLISSQFVVSQTKQSVPDSLWVIWNDPNNHDTIRLNALYSFTVQVYRSFQPDSAFKLAQLQYDFAESNGYKKHIAQALNIQGVLLQGQSDYINAIDYYNRSLILQEELGNKKGIAVSLNNIGMIYMNQGDYLIAIDYYTRSIIYQEELEDKQGMAATFNNIGNLYFNQGDQAKSIDYYTRSLKIKEELGDKMGIAATLTNIGGIYNGQDDFNMALDYFKRALKIEEEQGNKRGAAINLNNIGNIYSNQGDKEIAIDYYNRSLKIKEEQGDLKGIAFTLNSIGSLHRKQGDYTRALDYFTRSLTIREEIGNKLGIVVSLKDIGNIYRVQKDYTRAIAYSNRALTIAQEIGYAKGTQDAANSLYHAFESSGQFRKALEMHELYIIMRDSISSEENQREVLRQEYKYAYEKQAVADSLIFVAEKEIQEEILQTSRTQLFASIAVLILVLFIAFVFFRGRERQKKLNMELKNTQSQLVQSEKMASLGQLAAGVAHEINNPMNFIKTAIEGIKLNVQDLLSINAEYEKVAPDRSPEFKKINEKYDFEVIKDELEKQPVSALDGVARTSAVVIGLISFTGLESNIKKREDIHSIINNTLAVLSHTIPESIKIIKEFGDIPEIDCFPGRMNQVFANLLINSIEAISRKNRVEGIIRISTAVEDGFLIIRFEDNGDGISNDIKNKIFDPFFTTKDVGDGKGLGLSIAHGIIEEHSGEISIKSGHEEGTEIIISLKI